MIIRARAQTRLKFAPSSLPTPRSEKVKPQNMAMPPITGISPACCLRPPGISTRPIRSAGLRRKCARKAVIAKASSA